MRDIDKGTKRIEVAQAASSLLEALGHGSVTREGLDETPERVAKAFVDEWLSGYGKDPAEILKVFEDGAEMYDQMVFQGHIPVWSLCEHHLAPFFGHAYVAYVPEQRVVGLSKLTRLVDAFSRRLQVQERISVQVADALVDHLSPDVAVLLKCRHLCMESRGVRAIGTFTVTSALRGCFKEEGPARAEFLSFVTSHAS